METILARYISDPQWYAFAVLMTYAIGAMIIGILALVAIVWVIVQIVKVISWLIHLSTRDRREEQTMERHMRNLGITSMNDITKRKETV